MSEIFKGADLSDCGKYRYRLWRYWTDGALDMLGFIMLNPSTADADVDDPTIRKCMGFARRLGFNGIVVTNLFSYRATKPKDLVTMSKTINVVEDEPGVNNQFLLAESLACRLNIAGWGIHGSLLGRDKEIALLMEENGVKLKTLSLTKGGHPGHPLLLPYENHKNLLNWP